MPLLIGGLCFELANQEPRNTTDKSFSPGWRGGGRPCRGSGEIGSAHVPRRRPHMPRVCEYAAAVVSGKGHFFFPALVIFPYVAPNSGY